MRRTSDKSQLNYSLQNTYPVFLNTIKVTKKKGSWRNFHSQEKAKKYHHLM